MPLTIQTRGSLIAETLASRERARTAILRDESAWTAALGLSCVSWLMLAWIVGAALALAGGYDGTYALLRRIALLVIGAVATAIAVRAAFIIAQSSRLRALHDPRTLRVLGVAAIVLGTLFFVQFLALDTVGGVDISLALTAIGPAVLMAELSFALPAMAHGRFGTTIGGAGGYLWVLSAIALVGVAVVPAIWWMAPLLGAGAASCTAPAAVRLWRHFEGDARGA